MGSKRGRGSKSGKINEADHLFSTLIRIKELLHGDRVECFTCGKTMHFRNMQCGHYVKRGNMITRWLEDNARPQCPECNMFEDGKREVFAQNLDKETPGLSARLDALGREIAHYSSTELDRLIVHLKKRIRECGGRPTYDS